LLARNRKVEDSEAADHQGRDSLDHRSRLSHHDDMPMMSYADGVT
jgi:hypothetical protein